MMESFHGRFLELAEKETRCIIIPLGKRLPAGKYYLTESYCNDNNCDCRKVFINVLHEDEILATIGYGWEELEFYEKWACDRSIAKDMKGPILELGGYHTEYSEEILKLFKGLMLNDHVFIERLKRHYEMFKSGKKKNVGRNEQCPCGSGKKYKKCCIEQ